jgi:hypothetical protein
LIAREAVASETPASRATSYSVGVVGRTGTMAA